MTASPKHRQRVLKHLEAQSESAGYRIQQLLNALEPFARLAHDYDLEGFEGEHVIEIQAKHVRKAWVVFAKFAGDGNV